MLHRLQVSFLPARAFSACLILIFVLSACQSPTAAPIQPDATQALAVQSSSATLAAATLESAAGSSQPTTPTSQPVSTETAAAPAPTPQQAADSLSTAVFIADDIPAHLRETLELPEGVRQVSDNTQAGLVFDLITVNQSAGSGQVNWVYALAAPFDTVADDVTLADLKSVWLGQPAKDLPFQKLVVEPTTQAIFTRLWGPAGSLVKTKPANQLADSAWADKITWSILPFEQLEPRWKVIAVDGQSPLRKEFDPVQYGLIAAFALTGDAQTISSLAIQSPLAPANRRADHLTTVMLTGVTALVRGTASLMEVRGLDYPATDIGDWLREADILHISNEVPFAENCPQPFDWKDLVFCSRPKYIKLLEDVGADVIELTGDHFADWGPQAMLYTIDLYKKEGWPYYGGGSNLEEARQPALFEHNGNKIAFLGCNGKEQGYATASATTPGAAHCDFDRLVTDIKKIRQQGYLPIVTFQHLEYYQYIALPYLQVDFQRVADAGAVIVSGSQAHQPHAFELRSDSFLHYGLGNLFFDQTNQGDPPRTAFIDRHVFYEGRHISTELLTIYLVDYARSRPMTLPERQAMLETVFKASGW